MVPEAEENPEITPEDAAAEQGLAGTDMVGAYTQSTPMGTYLYIWDPQEKQFNSFIQAENAEDTDADFTPDGKAIDRTNEDAVRSEAMLVIQNEGYNINPNGTYPFSVEKDGVQYEYNKETGEFEEVKPEEEAPSK